MWLPRRRLPLFQQTREGGYGILSDHQPFFLRPAFARCLRFLLGHERDCDFDLIASRQDLRSTTWLRHCRCVRHVWGDAVVRLKALQERERVFQNAAIACPIASRSCASGRSTSLANMPRSGRAESARRWRGDENPVRAEVCFQAVTPCEDALKLPLASALGVADLADEAKLIATRLRHGGRDLHPNLARISSFDLGVCGAGEMTRWPCLR